MKWNHLPAAGGIYDQHPQLIEEFTVIFEEVEEYQEKLRKEEEQKARSKTPQVNPVVPRRR